MKRVLVCVVNNWAYLHSYFVESLTNLISYTNLNCKDIQFDVRFVWGAYIDVMRNEASTYTIKYKYDYLIMLDADMTYPEDTIERLVKHDKDVIGGLYYWKILRKTADGRRVYLPHAYRFAKADFLDEEKKWAPIDVSKIEKDVIEVDGLGGGGVCIKREVLEKIGSPQFECTWESDSLSGEDLLFCEKAKNEGFKVYCDLTLKYGHIIQSIVDGGVLQDMQTYSITHPEVFPGVKRNETKQREGITSEDIDEIMSSIKGKKFAGEIKKFKLGGKNNGKAKNS